MEFPRVSRRCGGCGKDNAAKRCSCLHENYCDRECQLAAWPTHKHSCVIYLKEQAKSFAGKGMTLPYARKLLEIAQQYDIRGGRKDARACYNESLEIFMRFGSRGDKYSATIMNRLANLLSFENKYEQAMDMHRKALNMSLRNPGCVAKFDAYQGMAEITGAMGDTATACSMMENAYKELQGAIQCDHLDLVECLLKLECAYKKSGDAAKGLDCLTDALAMLRRMGSENEKDFLSVILTKITGYLFDQGKFESALETIQSALEIEHEIHGRKHPNVAGSLHMMSIILCAMHRFDEALVHMRKALKIQISSYGEHHADVARSLACIAGVYWTRDKDYDEAIKLYEKAIEITTEIYGQDHWGLEVMYHNMGCAKVAKGDRQGGERDKEESARIGDINTTCTSWVAIAV